MTDLGEAIQDVENFFSEVQDTADDYLARLQGKDRSFIAKLIVWLFVFACLGSLIYVAYATIETVADWSAGAEIMITVLFSVILPVVTLVIGYYFGAETK